MKKHKRIICLLLTALFMLSTVFCQQSVRAGMNGDIFVSATGTSNAAGTREDPMDFLTATRLLTPGNTIWMHSGTYSFSSTITIDYTNCGAADAYKTISTLDKERVILDFSSMATDSSNRGVILSGKYWHLYGLEIKGAGDNGILLSGNNNKIEMCRFYNNRDTGLQISRAGTEWPANNYILNCTSYNNMDSSGENADGFAAKLTCGEGNVFDGCISYNNSDDGWDLYAKTETGPIGVVTIKNCLSFRNGKLTNGNGSASGDMNGFKLGGAGVGTPHIVKNCIAFENGAAGFTDNNNPTAIAVSGCTSFNNSVYTNGNKANFNMGREAGGKNMNLLSFSTHKTANDAFVGTITNSIYYNYNKTPEFHYVSSETPVNGKEKLGTVYPVSEADFVSITPPSTATDFHTAWRNTDGSINTHGFLELSGDSPLCTLASDGGQLGARLKAGDVPPTAVPTAAPIVPTSTPTATPNTPTAVPTPAPIVPTTVPTSTPIVPTATPAAPTTTPTPQPGGSVLGDVDTNGTIDVSDVLKILRYSIGLTSLDENSLRAADVSGNTIVDASDAVIILKYIVGRIDSF